MNCLKRYQKIYGLTVLMLSMSNNAYSSAFQLWEQDAASPGTFHAGYAALSNDASTVFYNPAGLLRVKNQQVVAGGAAVMTDFKYKGNILVSTLPPGLFNVTAQGGNFTVLPNLHYLAPINEKIGYGFSITIPFGLKTDYGRKTPLEYAATRTSVVVINISPIVLAAQLTDALSLGLGLDLQRMYAEFDQEAVFLAEEFTTSSTNKASDTAYGYHAGALYQFTPNTRLGLSYHAKVVHHLSGSSVFNGPLIEQGFLSSHITTRMVLPAYTALSLFHRFNEWAIMGTVIYTQWNVFKNLTLNNVSGIDQGDNSTSIRVVVPAYYKNTWNISLGTEYTLSEQVILRGGIGYDQTPVTNKYRNVQLPDNNRFVVALGAHYQSTKTIGLDVSFMHVFFKQAVIHPPMQVTGNQSVTLNGQVNGGADVIGAGITWDIL